MEVAASGLRGEACAQLAIGGHSAGDQDAGGAERFLCREGFAEQIADDGVLKACDQVEGLRVGGGESVFNGGLGGRVGAGEEGFATGFGFRAQVVKFDIAKDRGLDAGKREEKIVGRDWRSARF